MHRSVTHQIIAQDPSKILAVMPDLVVDNKPGAEDRILIFNLVLKFYSEFAAGTCRGNGSQSLRAAFEEE